VREFKEAKTDGEKQSLISAAYTLRTIITVGLALLLLVALPWLWPHPQYLLATACVLPLIFFESNQALWVLQAEERVPAQYLANVVSALVSATLIFTFIGPSSPAGSDMFASLVGLIAAFGMSWYFATGRTPRIEFNKADLLRVTAGTKWLFATALINYGYSKADLPLLGLLSSIEELGKYRTASQVVAALLPLTTIISLLLYPKLIQAAQNGPCALWHRQRDYLRKLTPIICLLIAIAFLVIPPLYPVVFGTIYEEAAIPCAILVSAKFVVVLNGVLVWGLWAIKRDRSVFLLMAVTALLSVTANVLFIPHFGMRVAALVQFASELFVLLTALLLCRAAGRGQIDVNNLHA
jgi:O-antigen/teichoic acid export membrane protein